MKSDMTDLKKLVFELMRKNDIDGDFTQSNSRVLKNLFKEVHDEERQNEDEEQPVDYSPHPSRNIQDTEEIIEESLSLAGKEEEMIKKALEKHNGKRKMAANELGISERTLYRKIKEYGIES